MKLSKLKKPYIRHKKIVSSNLGHLKNSISKNEIKEYTKYEIKEKEESQIINNINNDKDNDSELINSTQLDWVKSAIEVKTKNNKVIKLSLDNDNCFEEVKIKVNKIPKFKELDIKEKNEYKINDDINNKQLDIKINTNNNNLNKLDNKDTVYMISTKDSEKIDNNFKYLSHRKNINEVSFPQNVRNDDEYNENNEEDIVNMKTLSFFNKESDIYGKNKKYKLNRIYKKRIKNDFFNLKNAQRKEIKSKILDIRNINNFSNSKKSYTNEGKVIKSPLLIFKYDKKFIPEKKISYTKKIKTKNINNILDYSDVDNLSLYNYTNNNIMPYINSKNQMFTTNKNKETDNKKATEIALNSTNNNSHHNIFSNKTQKYQFITPDKSKINKNKSFYQVTKFIKKKVTHKFLSSSSNKSNLLLKNFLSQINLKKYYLILKNNGLDDLNLLIEQMRTNLPIKDSELKNAGINLPGDRAKILIRLEEKGNLFPFSVPKNVYYTIDKNVNINEDEKIINLKRWLKEFKMENYLNNFINNGYYSVELFLFQMISKNPINNNILQFEIGIEKIGHRSRILSILKEQSKNIEEILERKKDINLMNGTRNCGCYII